MKTDDLRPDIAAAAATMPSRIGAGRELKRLAGKLWDGETVDALISGTYAGVTGLLVLTTRRLLFTADTPLKAVSEDFPLDRVSSIGWTSGMVFGTVQITAGSVRAEITNVAKAAGKPFVDTARDRAATAPSTPVAAAPAASAPASDGLAEQLARLAQLRDAGVLTEEEFATAKARALGI